MEMVETGHGAEAFRTNGRSASARRAGRDDGLTGMTDEQADWEEGLDEDE